MTFWAEMKDHSRFLLGRAISTYFNREEGVPADSLTVKFSADSVWENLYRVYAYQEGELVFSGIVDEQNTHLDKKGFTVELVCRSLAALLLDNEAEPMTLRNPSWRVMCLKYAESFGLSAKESVHSVEVKGDFEIKKGESCWTVLSRYAEQFLGGKLTVNKKGELLWKQEEPRTRELHSIISAQQRYCPYKKISRIWIQNAAGAYQIGYNNEKTEGISRQRFFSYQDNRSPIAYVNQTEQEVVQWEIQCADFIMAEPGDRVQLNITGFLPQTDLYIHRIRYTESADGVRTIFVLREKEENKNVADKENNAR
ncbi:hypothetical protein [Scatolibacter rhodanostii]|uniref:hypothetical protein n=1 Tax=Scatolibacter rhodanostii TaxID=2014781 RepID=UPI000C074ECB|nr:hypothetical protein [Scatolibacter rhodanostii]